MQSNRRVAVGEDEHGNMVDLTVVRPSTPLTYCNRPRVEFAPLTTRQPCSRPTSARRRTQQADGDFTGSTRYEHVTPNGVRASAGYDDDNARQALLAIYQAGKPDMRFHARAPSTATLEKMLLAISDTQAGDASSAAGALRKYDALRNLHPQHRDAGHRYTDVSVDEKPVKVKVECPPRADTVFSFRVQSRAA